MVQPGRAPLAGRYELSYLLATGGMGQVWRGRDTLLDRPVAVKVLRSEYTGDPTFLARFRAEARHAAVLAHENIASVHDYGEVPARDGEQPAGEHLAYLVMELVDGEPLSALLAREGRLDVPRTLAIVRQTAAALGAAHAAGVVHRDVKPGNVLVRPDGQVKITDFGIAWSASSVPLTQTGQVVGTAHYLSPEQAEGGKAGPASDVYALGMIAYECLAGRRAFDGDSAVQIALRQIRDVPDPLPADVPEAVRSLVGRALLKNPAERFPGGAAVRDAVDDVLAGRSPRTAGSEDGGTRPLAVVWPTSPTSAGTAAGPTSLRARVLAPAIALLAGAAVAVGTVAVFAPAPAAPAAAADDSGARPTPVLVAARDYVGRPVDSVEADLAALGLRVERQARVSATASPGEVLEVGPTGALVPGDLVTVTFAVAPAESPAPATPSSPATVVVADEAPARADAPVRTADPRPVSPETAGGRPADGDGTDGNGNGNAGGSGNGNGKGNGNDPPGRGNGNGKGRAKG